MIATKTWLSLTLSFFASLSFFAALTGCTTTSDAAADDEMINPASPSTEKPTNEPLSPAASGDASGFNIGPVEDSELKTLIYDALKSQVEAEAHSGGIKTNLGEEETFEFTIVKLTLGDDDVSNDPRAGANGVHVEITGWLQKTLPTDSGDLKPECTSFDTEVPVRKTKESWALPAGHVFKFSREDAEDCY